MATKQKSVASRPVSGKLPVELLARAEAKSGYVALCVVGEPASDKIRVFTAINPKDVFKTAQQWNWREIEVHAVFWTPGKIFANRLKEAVEKELAPHLIRGSWYELDPAMVINTIIASAHEKRIEIFNDQQRLARFEHAVIKAMNEKSLLQLAEGVGMDVQGAEVVTFPKGRR